VAQATSFALVQALKLQGVDVKSFLPTGYGGDLTGGGPGAEQVAQGVYFSVVYLSIDALVQGLQAAGKNPTQAHFIDAMLGITNYSAAGLAGGHTMSFALQGRGSVSGYDNCAWMTQYSGTTFQLVPGMDPICGTTLKKGV
jgi:hypothetical protein